MNAFILCLLNHHRLIHFQRLSALQLYLFETCHSWFITHRKTKLEWEWQTPRGGKEPGLSEFVNSSHSKFEFSFFSSTSAASVSTEREPILQVRKRPIYTAGRPPWFDCQGQLVEPFLIGICGGSASGKTTVANKIIEARIKKITTWWSKFIKSSFQFLGAESTLGHLIVHGFFLQGTNDHSRDGPWPDPSLLLTRSK